MVKNVPSPLITRCQYLQNPFVYRNAYLPTSVSYPSASDEGLMYTVLKDQTFELMLSLDSGSYSFSAAIQSCFQDPHFIDTCAPVFD